MSYGPLLFLGILFTLASSWVGLVLAPKQQLGGLVPNVSTNALGAVVLYPQARKGEAFDLEQRLLFRFQSAQILDRCAELISRLFYSCGAQGTYRSSPLVRTFVDIHTGRTHIANNPFKVARNFGGVLLGNTNTDSFI